MFYYFDLGFAILLAADANSSVGRRMYLWYVSLLHLPRALMVESWTPLAAADVAAPILRL